MPIIDYQKFIDYINFAAEAHQKKVLATAKSIRTSPNGEQNHYFTHSLWCAVMILLDTKLPARIRVPGSQALLLHDVLEDTSSDLPEDVSEEVKMLVEDMTYMGGFNEEKIAVLEKSPLVQLLKLYDKTATLYDGDLDKSMYSEWTNFMEKLIKTIENEYGILNIVLLARDLIKKYQTL